MKIEVRNRPQAMVLVEKVKLHPGQSARWYAQFVGRPAPSVRRDMRSLEAVGLVRRIQASDGTVAWVAEPIQSLG